MANEEETNHFRVIVDGAYINNNDYRYGAFSDRIKNVLRVREPKIITVVNQKNGGKKKRAFSVVTNNAFVADEKRIRSSRGVIIVYFIGR